MELKIVIDRLKEYLNYCADFEKDSVRMGIKILEQAQASGGQLPPPVSTLVGKREKWV